MSIRLDDFRVRSRVAGREEFEQNVCVKVSNDVPVHSENISRGMPEELSLRWTSIHPASSGVYSRVSIPHVCRILTQHPVELGGFYSSWSTEWAGERFPRL